MFEAKEQLCQVISPLGRQKDALKCEDSWLIDGEALIQKFEKFEMFKNGEMNKSCLKLPY